MIYTFWSGSTERILITKFCPRFEPIAVYSQQSDSKMAQRLSLNRYAKRRKGIVWISKYSIYFGFFSLLQVRLCISELLPSNLVHSAVLIGK
jgi:ribosomal protein L33